MALAARRWGEHTMDIRVEELEKSFDERQILNKISLAVHNKEFVGIIGPNGSGKRAAPQMPHSCE